jgi:hypothetical protein
MPPVRDNQVPLNVRLPPLSDSQHRPSDGQKPHADNETPPGHPQTPRDNMQGGIGKKGRGSIGNNTQHQQMGNLMRKMGQRAPGVPNATQEAEAALKALREAPDKEAQRRAAEALERAMKNLKEQLK